MIYTCNSASSGVTILEAKIARRQLLALEDKMQYNELL